MANFISAISNTTPLGVSSWTSAEVVCTNVEVVGASILSDNNLTLKFNWSADGVTTLITDTDTIVGGVATNVFHPVKGKYVNLELVNAGTNTSLNLQGFFFDMLSLSVLKNLGAGSTLFDLSTLGMKSITAGTGVALTPTSTELNIALNPANASLYNSYGGIVCSPAYTQSIVNTTPTLIAPSTTITPSVYEFAQFANGILTYTGAYSKVFSVAVDFDFNTSDAVQTFTFELRLNGVSILSQRTSLTHSEYEHISLQAYTSMATSDTLSVFAYNNGVAPINTTVAGFNLRAVQTYFPLMASPPTGNGEYSVLNNYSVAGFYPYVWQSTTTPNPYINVLSSGTEWKATYPGNYQFTIGTQVFGGGAYSQYNYQVLRNGLLVTTFPMGVGATDGFSFNLTLAVSDIISFGVYRTSGSGGRTLSAPLYITSAPTAPASSGSYTLAAGVATTAGSTTTWTWTTVSQYNPDFVINVPNTTFQCIRAGTYRFGYSQNTISGGTYSTSSWLLVVNSVTVYTGTFSDQNDAVMGDSTTYALNAGDLVQIRWTNTFVSGTRTIIPTLTITV